MNYIEYKDRIDYMVLRASKKTGLTKKQVREVFGVIADLRWDWKKSKYDLCGLEIEKVLEILGDRRCPLDRLEDLV